MDPDVPTTVQESEDLAREIETSWQLLVKGYGQLRHAVVDVGGSQNQVAILTGLMRYTKLLVTSMLVHISNFKVVQRSEQKELGLTLDTQLKPVAVPSVAERKQGPPGKEESMQVNGNGLALEHSLLRQQVGVLAEELVRELEKGVGGPQQDLLNAMATRSRQDTEVSYALSQHIKDRRLPPPPANAARDAVADMTAMNTALKERMDRLKADNMKLSADKFTLMADKALLVQRVQAMEATLADRNAALAKYRHLTARARGLHPAKPQADTLRTRSPSPAVMGRRTPGSTVARAGSAKRTVTVGGVEMEPEVVQWLREMYQSLAEDAPADPVGGLPQEALAEGPDFKEAMARKKT